MSDFQQGFKSQGTLAELLNYPLTDFSALRFTLYPKVTGAEFRKNLYRVLGHGKALSSNGKTPSLLATLLGCANAGNVLDVIGKLPGAEYPGAEVYEEFIENSFDAEEDIIRHAADTTTDKSLPTAERQLSMFIYTKMSNGLARRYQITWIPANGGANKLSVPALVINFEQSSFRNMAIPHPPSANGEITKIINAAATVRNDDYSASESPADVTVWAFYWDAEQQPTYVHTYLDVDLKPIHHSVVVPTFDRFPVLHAVSKEWDVKRFIEERLSHLLRDFTRGQGKQLAGKFEAILHDRTKGSSQIAGAAEGESAEELVNRISIFFGRCCVLPEFTKLELLYAPAIDTTAASYTLNVYMGEGKQSFVCSLT